MSPGLIRQNPTRKPTTSRNELKPELRLMWRPKLKPASRLELKLEQQNPCRKPTKSRHELRQKLRYESRQELRPKF